MKGSISPKPKQNLLDGITDVASARKKMYVARTNQSDDSIQVNWNEAYKELVVCRSLDANNALQISATEDDGVCYKKKVDGTWTIVPTSVTHGGTGARTAHDARTNLELNPVAVSITAASNVTLNHNESFKIGKVGFIMAQFTINADNVSKLGTIASGSRPKKNFYGNMFNDTEKSIVSLAINTGGEILTGNPYVKNKAYRIFLPYWIN